MKGGSGFDGKLTVCKQKRLQANGTVQSTLLGARGGGGARASPGDGEGRRCWGRAREAEQAAPSNFSSVTRRRSDPGPRATGFVLENGFL